MYSVLLTHLSLVYNTSCIGVFLVQADTMIAWILSFGVSRVHSTLTLNSGSQIASSSSSLVLFEVYDGLCPLPT